MLEHYWLQEAEEATVTTVVAMVATVAEGERIEWHSHRHPWHQGL